MKRRTILGLATCLALVPKISLSQSARVHRVVLVGIAPLGSASHLLEAFERGLRERGRVPGKDVVIEVRSANGDIARYPEIVTQVVASKPDVIVTSINANTLPVKAATRSIPIVMAIGTEVVASGLVRSLARPGGNVTGMTWDVGPESATKRMEILKELVPTVSRVGILWEAPYGEEYLRTTQDAAKALGMRSFGLEFSGDMQGDFSALRRNGAEGVYVHHGNQLFGRRAELSTVAMQLRLPTACGSAEVVDAGALMSYGPSLSDLFRRAAGHVDKILKGAKPADLPVERPVRLELVINARTAKALALTVPQSVRVRADRIVT